MPRFWVRSSCLSLDVDLDGFDPGESWMDFWLVCSRPDVGIVEHENGK